MKLFHSHNHGEKLLAQVLPDQDLNAGTAIRKAVKIGCGVNLMLMILKLCVGHFGHSEALEADGFHSLNDVAADLIMLLFVGISFRKPDGKYNYGYGKFETLSSVLMSVFLIAIACMLAVRGATSIMEYFEGGVLERPDVWTLIVILFAMGCKEGLYRYYSSTARRVGSKALLANAWHHRSDALASIATLVGVGCAYFFGESMRVFDPIASVLIAIFIFVAALKMFLPAIGELMEKSLPEADVQKAREAIMNVEGVDKIEDLKCRRNGHHYVFDVRIVADKNRTLEELQQITERVKRALRDAFCPHIIVNVEYISR